MTQFHLCPEGMEIDSIGLGRIPLAPLV
ncbi:hypothetical protein PSAB6_10207 [Paraburkholderia sabiae]|nr:hypothetical protein PSAB6_10207 [Paraburkholderia sabiae]